MKSRAGQGRRMVTTKKRRGKITAPTLPAGESGGMDWKYVEADALNPSIRCLVIVNAANADQRLHQHAVARVRHRVFPQIPPSRGIMPLLIDPCRHMPA